MDDSRDESKDGQQNVDNKVCTASELESDSKWRQNDGKNDAENVDGRFRSLRFSHGVGGVLGWGKMATKMLAADKEQKCACQKIKSKDVFLHAFHEDPVPWIIKQTTKSNV